MSLINPGPLSGGVCFCESDLQKTQTKVYKVIVVLHIYNKSLGIR